MKQLTILVLVWIFSMTVLSKVRGQPPSMATMSKQIRMTEMRPFNDTGEIMISEKDRIGMMIQFSKFDTSSARVKENYRLYKSYFGDSLRTLFNGSSIDTIKAEALSHMGSYIAYDSVDFYYDSTVAFIDKVLLRKNQKHRLSLLKQKISALHLQASFNWNMANYLKSFELTDKMFNLIETEDSLAMRPSGVMISSLHIFYGVDNEKMHKYLDIMESKILTSNLKDSVAWILWNNLAMTYSIIMHSAIKAGNYEDAKGYANLAAEKLKNIPPNAVGSQTLKKVAYLDLGRVYDKLNNSDSSIYFYKQALISNIRNYNDSLQNYGTLLEIGRSYYKSNQFDSALFYFNYAYQLHKDFKTSFNVGKTYLYLNKRGRAVKYLLFALDTLENNPGFYFSQTDSMDMAKVYSEYFERAGNHKAALKFYKQFTPKYDAGEVWNKAKEDKINSSYAKLQYEKQKQQFDLENKIKNEQQSKRRTMNMSLLGGSGGAIVLLGLAFINVKNKRRREVAELVTQVGAVEMKSLRSQMNPHFIFNSLQSIQNFLISNKSEDANEYLLKFSKLMRLVLENSMQQEVPLKDDILALDLYMQLEQLRFTRPFSYEIMVEDSVNPEVDSIPPLLLQPFVENSIWHGLQYKSDSGKIMIRFKKEEDNLICVVEDNGVGRSFSKELKEPVFNKESLGMKLTEERISLLHKVHGVEAKLSVFDLFSPDNKPSGTRVEVWLPMAE